MQQLPLYVCSGSVFDAHLKVYGIFEEILSDATKPVQGMLPDAEHGHPFFFWNVVARKFVAGPKVVQRVFLLLLPSHKVIHVATGTHGTLTG